MPSASPAWMKTCCLTLDLNGDPGLIVRYKWYRQQRNIWPEVIDNICGLGIVSSELYLLGEKWIVMEQIFEGK